MENRFLWPFPSLTIHSNKQKYHFSHFETILPYIDSLEQSKLKFVINLYNSQTLLLVLYLELKVTPTVSLSIKPVIFPYVGRIINVSSVAGLYGYPGLSVYSATKHALEGYSAALRQECAKFNVNVVTVQPGDFSKATHLLDNHHK